MDGHQQNPQYTMNFGTLGDQQAALQQHQLSLQQQQQEYPPLFLSQQSAYLNMPMIYNQTQNMQPQSIDMQTLQRQQQILQALNPQSQHQLPQQTSQQQLLIDQNIAAHSNPMSQHLQQQLYASSMHFQAGLQQQPSNLQQLAALQSGSHLFQQVHHQGQTQSVLPGQTQPAPSQFQQAFYQKPAQIDYGALNVGQIGTSTMLSQQPQYTSQQQIHQQHPSNTSQQHVMHQQNSQQARIFSNQQRPSHEHTQRQSSALTEQSRPKPQEEVRPTLKSPTLKSPAQQNVLFSRLTKRQK